MKQFIMVVSLVVAVVFGSLAIGTASAAPAPAPAASAPAPVAPQPTSTGGAGANVMIYVTSVPTDTAHDGYPSSALRYDGYTWVSCTNCGTVVRKGTTLVVQLPAGATVVSKESFYSHVTAVGSIGIQVCGSASPSSSIPVSVSVMGGLVGLSSAEVYVHRSGQPVPNYNVGGCGMK